MIDFNRACSKAFHPGSSDSYVLFATDGSIRYLRLRLGLGSATNYPANKFPLARRWRLGRYNVIQRPKHEDEDYGDDIEKALIVGGTRLLSLSGVKKNLGGGGEPIVRFCFCCCTSLTFPIQYLSLDMQICSFWHTLRHPIRYYELPVDLSLPNVLSIIHLT